MARYHIKGAHYNRQRTSVPLAILPRDFHTLALHPAANPLLLLQDTRVCPSMHAGRSLVLLIVCRHAPYFGRIGSAGLALITAACVDSQDEPLALFSWVCPFP